jgi:hypothetical protein
MAVGMIGITIRGLVNLSRSLGIVKLMNTWRDKFFASSVPNRMKSTNGSH